MEVIKVIKRENRAITLVSLVVLVAVLMIITSTMAISINTRYQSQNLDKLSSDLKLLNDKVLLYYTENGEYPIKSQPLYEQVYELELSKLSGLTLNFGSVKDEEDVYIIDTSNGLISYKKGIEYKGEIYTFINENQIDEVEAKPVLKINSYIVEIQDDNGNVKETKQITESNKTFNIESETKVVFKVATNITEGVLYQWYKNEEEISDATNNIYQVDSIESGSNYYCEITYDDITKKTEKVRLFLED